jgi:hypothetical protein
VCKTGAKAQHILMTPTRPWKGRSSTVIYAAT